MTELLTNPDALDALCAAIKDASFVGLDTEFVRERTYFAKLCLIQVALPDAIVLIDPLEVDIRPLGVALKATNAKILHAGRQDLELLLQETGELPAALFDTQMAAALAGHDEQIGYAGLVAHRLKVELNKDATRTNWALRPLSSGQLAYAKDDVRYLEALREDLGQELTRLGRLDWLAEDCGALTDRTLYSFSAAQLTRRYRQGAGLSGHAQSIFQELLVWRESQAKMVDLPRTWVIADGALVDLAQNPPKDRADFCRRRDLNKPSVAPLADAILKVIEEAPGVPTYPWAPPTLKPEEERLYAALVAVIEARAKDLAFKAGVICSRRNLKEIAQGVNPGPLAYGWRLQVLGEEGAQLLRAVADLHA